MGVRGPDKNPANTEKRRQNMAKARAQRAKNRKASKEAKAAGLPDPYPLLRPQAGKRFTFDDVVTAVLEADDAVESKRIVAAMTTRANHGDAKAAAFLVERSLGKPIQKVQLSGGLTLETLDAALPEGSDDGHDPLATT